MQFIRKIFINPPGHNTKLFDKSLFLHWFKVQSTQIEKKLENLLRK